jgi:ATP-dependent Lon protease, bacterial type
MTGMKLPRQRSSIPFPGPENPLDPLARDLPLPTELPLLPVQDAVVFPHMILPLVIGRRRSQTAVDEALEGDRLVFSRRPEGSGGGRIPRSEISSGSEPWA